MAKGKLNFEDALARLEKIVESIEKGDVGLEESIKHFEEGVKLIRQCRRVLAEAELKIRHLQAADGGDGEPVVSATGDS